MTERAQSIQWLDAFFSSLIIVEILKQISFQPLAMFASLFSEGLSNPKASPQSVADKVLAVMFLTQIALAFLLCGAIGLLLGRRWGYICSSILSGIFFIGTIVLLAQSGAEGQRLMNILSLFLYGAVAGYSLVKLGTGRALP